ncbi:MAG: DUF2207 domain-containing protein [Bacilli bacterium]|nr:DUF2207 domain-containing protein [Bacilli bacterium]
MKKIIYGMFIFLISSTLVHASNDIYSIDMDIYLDEQGNANITEVWDVKGSDGSEWYKGYTNMGNIDLANFTVSMDGMELTKKVWDVDENLSEKKGYYGVNTTSNGFELCFGKYDYKRHKFTLKYTLTNMVFNTEDAQVVYNTFIDRLSSVNFENFHVKISSYYKFPDNLDVWGYGYKGYAYVKDGVIEASNEGNMNGNYVVLLVKFPSETFDTNIGYSSYQTFNDVYNRAEQGTFDYDYDEEESSFLETLFSIIIALAPFIFVVIGIVAVSKSGYGYINNKKIDKKETPFFRDIPCNKDIYYANTLTKLNLELFGKYKETNILGAIMLKWVREDKIKFIKEEKSGILGKEKSSIDLRLNHTFDNALEKELFDTMYKASGDGILETKELEKWARKNYSKFFDLFKRIDKVELLKLEKEGHLYKRKDKNECKKRNVMDDTIYNESVKLYGLKRFLDEFSRMDTKEVLEVKLWDEYLMYAYIFGIADKVAKQLKNLYPEVIQEYNYDYDTLILISNISNSGVSAASSARSAAESYSSGGGGFSSGGGGGGSFGGGGGGGSR